MMFWSHEEYWLLLLKCPSRMLVFLTLLLMLDSTFLKSSNLTCKLNIVVLVIRMDQGKKTLTLKWEK